MSKDKQENTDYSPADIGARIVKVRESLGMNQKEFAATIDMYPNHLSNIETGRRSPNMSFFHKLGAAHRVSLDYLVFGEGEMFRMGTGPGGTRPPLLLGLDTIDEFTWLLRHSLLFRGAMFSNGLMFMTENYEIIKKHMDLFSKEKKEKEE